MNNNPLPSALTPQHGVRISTAVPELDALLGSAGWLWTALCWLATHIARGQRLDLHAREMGQACFDHRNPFELLAATILSAQTTDVRVNLVTPELFRRYPTMQDVASANQEELAQVIDGLNEIVGA